VPGHGRHRAAIPDDALAGAGAVRGLAKLHDTAATHPAPIPPNLQAVMANTQARKCQPARLVSLLRKHDMPDVVGCTRDVVDSSFKRADLGVAKAVPQASDAPNGVVFRQDPPVATRLVPGRQVTLFISTGPARQVPPESNVQPASAATVGQGPAKQAMTAVPPVSGFAEARGLEAIRGRLLVPILGGKEFSSVPGGRMIRTDPPVDEVVPQGTPVRYWESLGPALVPAPATPPEPPPVSVSPVPRAAKVPPVTGKTPAEALLILRKAGFAAGEPIPEFTLSGTGRISRQDPLAGRPLSQGEMVLLWRSYAWLSTLGLAAVPLLILGSVAGLAFMRLVTKRRLAYTRAVLCIQASLSRDGETQLVRAIPPAGPALVLRASLQPGEVHFAGSVSIERREIQHD
jgi:Uncharacterized protein conserved in bacteria